MIHQHVPPSQPGARFGAALLSCALSFVAACGSTRFNSVQPTPVKREGLSLEAGAECRSRTHFGGAVTPSQWKLRVVNRTGVGTPWRVVSDQPWLTLPVSEGSTTARAESVVIACIDPDAGKVLAGGEHLARVGLYTLDDAANPVATLEVRLLVDSRAANTPESGAALIRSLVALQETQTSAPAQVANQALPDTGHWTDLQPSSDSRLVYVSSSMGNDANSGLTPDLPKATIAAGKALLRNGHPDWLLLRRGDTWSGSFGQWLVCGRSDTEPAVLTSYGTANARPHIATGTQDGLFTIQNSASPAVLRHIRIVGLRFTCDGHTGVEGTPRGISWHVPFDDLLIEDCSFQYFHTNLVIEPLSELGRDFRLRRSVVADAFTTQSSHSQGLYVANTEGVLLEENVFDHNGWREDVTGAVPTIFRHNVYLQTNTTAVRAIGNIFANGASHGLQAREGGLIEDNLFVQNAIALLLGSDWQTKEPIRFIARHNVITEGRDLDAATPRGFGIDVPAAASGLITRNLIVNQRNVGFPVAMNLYDGSTVAGLHDVVVEANTIHDWLGPVIVQGQAPQTTGVVLRQNAISNTLSDNLLVENSHQPNGSIAACSENLLWSNSAPANGWCRIGTGNVGLDAWKTAMGDTTTQALLPNYVDPERTVGAYDLRLGGAGTVDSFLALARRQSKIAWRPEYTANAVNDWMREGFRTQN